MATLSFKKNLKIHELIGMILIFVGASWLGLGIYSTMLASNRLLVDIPLLSTNQLLIFPVFYGLGALLIAFGTIELKHTLPGRNRGEK